MQDATNEELRWLRLMEQAVIAGDMTAASECADRAAMWRSVSEQRVSRQEAPERTI